MARSSRFQYKATICLSSMWVSPLFPSPIQTELPGEYDQNSFFYCTMGEKSCQCSRPAIAKRPSLCYNLS